MLRSLKQLYGDKLGASDGEIGHVKDFYFDDQNWAVRLLLRPLRERIRSEADEGSRLNAVIKSRYRDQLHRHENTNSYHWVPRPT